MEPVSQRASNADAQEATQRAVELLARCALRDREAFAALYELTSAKLYGLILRIVRDEELASDVLQDGYLRIWSHADEFRPDKASPITWMGSIMRNRAIDLLRRRRTQALSDTPVDDMLWLDDERVEAPEMATSRDQGSTALHQCLKQLSTPQRQVIMLAYFRGLTHEEMATYLQTPLGTVKSWLRRGLLRLKECLDEQ